MFFPFVLLFWIVLVIFAMAAFVASVQEAQEKGRAAKRTAAPKVQRTHHRTTARRVPVLHHGH